MPQTKVSLGRQTDLNAASGVITGHGTPTNPTDVANKAYADGLVTGTQQRANIIDRETPSGSINGTNTAFTLANTPIAGTEHVYLNGLLQEPGAGNDYTISGAAITYLTAPLAGDKIRVSYRK